MKREIEQGWSVVFTIDGPRGPIYVAKPGPAWLSRSTGVPIVPFFIAPVLLSKMGEWLGDSYPADFLMLVAIALYLWGFVEILCLRGTRGPNRFGPDPQAPVNRGAHRAPNWQQLRELEFVRRGAGPSPGA